jgi:hypothetical protein
VFGDSAATVVTLRLGPGGTGIAHSTLSLGMSQRTYKGTVSAFQGKCVGYMQNVPFTPTPRQQLEPRRQANGIVGRWSRPSALIARLDKLS